MFLYISKYVTNFRDQSLSLIHSISFFQQPDLSVIEVPPKEKKFKGYFYIARHYKWALDYMFLEAGHEAVVIVEGGYRTLS